MRVLIVGAGLAGLRTAEALRQHGHTGDITLVGAEPHRPYSRPPLSKEVLRGDAPPAAATLRSDAELAELRLDLRLGTSATGLDVAGHEVTLADGDTVGYDRLVVATGAAPRRLPGVDRPGVHVLRTVDDCAGLAAALRPGASVAVVGAGFVGLEVAASARTRGCAVTVVDVLPAPLARVLPATLGAAVARLHADHDVTLRCGVGVEAAGPDRLRLTDGSEVAADTVVVGIGVTPQTGWLEGSTLTVDDGLVCDETLRAGPDVWAVGDVARWPLPAGGTLRLEHWTNATEQPQAVARDIVTGTATPFRSVPYFWSDQYDAKLACLGLPSPGDHVEVVAGSLDGPKWVALLRSADRLSAVVGLGMAGRVMRLRPLLAAGASWADALAAAS